MRAWTNDAGGDRSVHAMGNGELVAYGRGPDLICLYGAPLSAPNTLTLTTEFAGPLRDEARREPGTAIWQHRLCSGDDDICKLTEFAVAGLPVYTRRVHSSNPGIRWRARIAEGTRLFPCEGLPGLPAGWLLVTQPAHLANNMVYNLWTYQLIVPWGAVQISRPAEDELQIAPAQGEGGLFIAGSWEYPRAVAHARAAFEAGWAQSADRTRNDWRGFTARRLAACQVAAAEGPVAELFDAAAVMLKAQQALTGGVLPAEAFNLAYMRDAYGALRGMLRLGMLAEARAEIQFRYDKFAAFGSLKTAEQIGSNGSRHVHENDDVEGPADAILAVRDYLQATGDREFARSLWPMLEWCWKAQRKHLADGMLPFSGDETYVAGEFYPRSGLCQGSADTTMAFATAGRWLSTWAVSEGFWRDMRAKSLVLEVERALRTRFFAGGRIWANAPARKELLPPPEFRYGVCEAWLPGEAVKDHPLWFGWQRRSNNGRYLCPACYGRRDLPPERPAPLELCSVTLLPVYLGCDVFTPAEVRSLLDALLARRLPNGYIRTSERRAGFVGYDPGLLLINAIAVDHPAAAECYERLLHLADRTGTWNEYYDDDGVPIGAYCNAWSTGISVEALARYLSHIRPQ